jgi:hypothetical protein
MSRADTLLEIFEDDSSDPNTIGAAVANFVEHQGDDLPMDLAEIIETSLEVIDPNGEMSISDAVSKMSMDDASKLYNDVKTYCDEHQIDFEGETDTVGVDGNNTPSNPNPTDTEAAFDNSGPNESFNIISNDNIVGKVEGLETAEDFAIKFLTENLTEKLVTISNDKSKFTMTRSDNEFIVEAIKSV